EQVKALNIEAEKLMEAAQAAIKSEAIIATVDTTTMPAALPTGSENQTANADATKAVAAANVIRFGAVDEPTDLVMREVYGGDFRQVMYDQRKSFVKYLRRGIIEPPALRQLWSPGVVKSMLMDGLGVEEIRSTMVEGQDVLGGVAVPPDVADATLGRLPGLTAVRGGGAMVVQTASGMIYWLKITGGTSRYPTALRGAWGNETTRPPSEKNLTFGLEMIPVYVYTYRVPFSASFLEDATNVLQVFQRSTGDTLAIDEDEGFLVGDGANKPRGILPGGANAEGLTEVNSGHATELKYSGLRSLRRGVASQYRAAGRASLIGNSATGEDIENFLDGMGRPYYDELVSGTTRVQSAIWRESEAMPDIAASAFPLLYGDLSGYIIVERLGMSIQRYNDSYTGINLVEFHVRRRIGGRLMESWKMAAQKVSA
ncbi:MAG: phage major capsid protein, partial [Phycisphaerae bacterium]